ncbi:hypothetical protein WN55_05462 [Dufourea novaeangliae]|uniref:Uncharacterized protein n=1 Tax=Dufourea novaeangliae TaxID=178035 RepID=A0A154PMU7_DUFNO|nr:hypothetical protein WN55_05462 [Dufourea novaeangliae]
MHVMQRYEDCNFVLTQTVTTSSISCNVRKFILLPHLTLHDSLAYTSQREGRKRLEGDEEKKCCTHVLPPHSRRRIPHQQPH